MDESSSSHLDSPPRTQPNILVTGTPGTGKSTYARALVEATGLRLVDVGQLVKDNHLHNGWDEEYQSYILDEDRVRARCAEKKILRWREVL